MGFTLGGGLYCKHDPQHAVHAPAQTDGKAARNLLKLQLFRQFYVMVVAYIYITRILVYLLRSTMPYRYVWLSDASGEHPLSVCGACALYPL